MNAWNDPVKGVEVKQSAFGNEATIIYNGLLARSGADQVYLHCGYGNPVDWHSVSTQKMDRTPRGWEKTIRMIDNTAIICFKDSANNWDNNSGHNWIIRS